MSKEKLISMLERIAEIHEKSNELYEESEGLFCGRYENCEIHIAKDRWDEVVNTIQPVVTYNPNWDARYVKIEAYFYLDLCGKKYKLFALLDKEAVK